LNPIKSVCKGDYYLGNVKFSTIIVTYESQLNINLNSKADFYGLVLISLSDSSYIVFSSACRFSTIWRQRPHGNLSGVWGRGYKLVSTVLCVMWLLQLVSHQ